MLLKLIEQFLTLKRENDYSSESSIVTYRRKLLVFYEFLTIRKNLNDYNCQDCLQGMQKETVLSSVEYYIDTYNIEFKTTIDTYLTVITTFMQFLCEIKKGNVWFSNIQNIEHLKICVEKLCKEKNLNLKQQILPISEAECAEIIAHSNEVINNFNPSTFDITKKNKRFTLFISGIITKLVLLTGARNNVISKLTIHDINKECTYIQYPITININGFNIHLPYQLSYQLNTYINLRNQLLGNNEIETLFISLVDFRPLQNYTMFRIVDDIHDKCSATAVAKYTITKMLNSGINPTIIKKLTGYSSDVIGHCIELINDENNYETQRIIDSKIRNFELFDRL